MKQKDLHFTAFNEKWFEKNQRVLLWLFNLVYKFFPSLFFKSGERDDFKGNKIIEVGTNHATCDAGLQYFKKSSLYETASKNPENNHRTRRIYKKLLKKVLQGKIKEEIKLLPARKTVFFTDWNYSQMLYNAFKPLWWTIHYWDTLVANNLNPTWNFGFDTLTAYPQAGEGGANVTCDGKIEVSAVDETWSTIRGRTDAVSVDNVAGETNPVTVQTSATTNQYQRLRRFGMGFDTSALPDTATISAATLSVYVITGSRGNALVSDWSMHACGFTPATNNQFVVGDFDQFGNTSFGSIAYASLPSNDYGDYSLNASGIANISKIGVSNFGFRHSNDINNVEPTWSASKIDYCVIQTADTAGTGSDPKLVVTYTVVSGPANLKSYNTNLAANIKSINTNLIANVKSLDTNV